jgi:hypothetical protein
MIGLGRVQSRDGHAVRFGEVRWIDGTGDERTANIDTRGWYSVSGLRNGPWRVYADCYGYRPIDRQVESNHDGLLHCDLELDPLERLAIKFQTPAGAPLLKAAAPGGKWNLTHLSVVATRTPPGTRLEMVDQNSPDEYGIGRFHAQESFGAMGERLVPDGCAGSLELREPLPAYASLVLRDLVIETRLVPAGTREITYTIPDDALTSRLVQAHVRVVDFSGKPLAGVFAALETFNARASGVQTDANGVAHIENAPPGIDMLRLNREGLETLQRVVEAQPGVDIDLGTVRLGPPARVSGTIVDERGRPLAAALTWRRLDLLERVEGFRHMDRLSSDADGLFKIEQAPRTKLLLNTTPSVLDRACAGVLVDASNGDVNNVVVMLEPAVHVVLDFHPVNERPSSWILHTLAGMPVDADEIEVRRPVRFGLVPGAYVLEIVTADGIVHRQPIDARAGRGMVNIAW